MSSTTTVDGLVSGLQTTQVIAQLMQVAAQPQTVLKSEVASENKVVSAYQSVNSRLLAVQTAAEAFTAPSALVPTNPTWQSVKATSSSSAVVATATAGAATGSFNFDVTALAKAQVSTAVMDPAAPGTTGAGIDLTVGSTTTHLDPTADTPQGVADAINKAKLGVSAALVTTTQGTVLQLTGSTGTANAFSVAGLNGSLTDVTGAADAEITVGDPAHGTGYTVTSGTNTFSNIIPNVTLTVNQQTTGGVSVNVASDTGAIADKMQALVDSVNGALSQISSQTAYNAASKSGGPLMGDFAVRSIQSNLLSTVSSGVGGYGDLKQLGVQLDRSGNLTFDRNAFTAAYAANPSGVQTAVANGLAKSLDGVAKAATDPISGNLTTAIQGHHSQVTRLTKQISDWDVRLTAKQAAYQKQFTGLEVALGKMKDQSSWLSSQIAGLPTTSG
jgi:flagellar hook-associated protein 2